MTGRRQNWPIQDDSLEVATLSFLDAVMALKYHEFALTLLFDTG